MEVSLTFIYGFPVSEEEMQSKLLKNKPFVEENSKDLEEDAPLEDIFKEDLSVDGQITMLEDAFDELVISPLVEETLPPLDVAIGVHSTFYNGFGENANEMTHFVGVAGGRVDYDASYKKEHVPVSFNLGDEERGFTLETRAAVAAVKKKLGLSGHLGFYLLAFVDNTSYTMDRALAQRKAGRNEADEEDEVDEEDR